jgi:hypothetical protein
MQETNRESRAHAGNKQRIQSPCRKQSDIPEPIHESFRESKARQQAFTYNPQPKQEAIKDLGTNAGSNPKIQSPSRKQPENQKSVQTAIRESRVNIIRESRAHAGNKQRIQSPCRKQSDIPEPMHVTIRLSRALAASNHIQSKDQAGSN